MNEEIGVQEWSKIMDVLVQRHLILFVLWLLFNTLERTVQDMIFTIKKTGILNARILFPLNMFGCTLSLPKEGGSWREIFTAWILNKIMTTVLRCLLSGQRTFYQREWLVDIKPKLAY